MLSLDEVGEAARALPEVIEADRKGSLTWSVGARTFAWQRPFTKADVRRFGAETPPGGTIVAVRVADLDDKTAVLAQGLRGVFTIPHFDGFAAVLLHLDEVDGDAALELIVDGWLACAPPRLVQAYLAER